MSNATTSRASVYQGIFFAWEANPGVIPVFNRRMIGFALTQTPSIPIKSVRYNGSKGITGTQHGFKHTEARLEGAIDFNNLAYFGTLAWGAATLSTDSNAVKAYTREWNPSAIEPLTGPITGAFLQGSVKGAEKFGHAFMPDFSFKWSKEEASLSGMILGQTQARNADAVVNVKMTLPSAILGATTMIVTTDVASGVIPAGTYYSLAGKKFIVEAEATITTHLATLTLTALEAGISANDIANTVPTVPTMPADPNSFGVYVSLDGDSWTRLLDTLEGEVICNGLWEAVFHHSDDDTLPSYQSFDTVVEKAPGFTASLTLEEGSEADDFMEQLENGTKVFFGVKVLGLEIDGTAHTRHMWRFYVPAYVTKPDPGDKGEVFGNTFTFEYADDPAFGMFKATLVNKLAVL